MADKFQIRGVVPPVVVPDTPDHELDVPSFERLINRLIDAGVKDSSGDDISFRYLVQENEKLGHPLTLLTGHEVVVDGAYLGGADGSVPGLANVEPEGYVRMWKAAQAGDWATVKAEQDRLNEISHIWDVTSGVQGYAGGVGAFKTALNLMGVFDSPTMPRPVKAMTGENVEAIRKVLADNGLL